MRTARVPEGIGFQTKPELGLQMLRRAVGNEVPLGTGLADTAYGTSRASAS
jgi:SRSO17 transposase